MRKHFYGFFTGDVLSQTTKDLFFKKKHGYLQHSKDKHEFQTFHSQILDAGMSRIGSEFVLNLEKNSENPVP